MNIFEMLIYDYTLRTVAIGSAIIGLVSGALGCFAFLRRQSLVGDVVAHSSLLGIVIAFLISYWLTGEGTKASLPLLLGAGIAGLLAMLLVTGIIKRTRIKTDAALGIMLAVFFGSGVFVLKMIQQRPIPGKAGLSDYIFGMAATITRFDVSIMAVLAALALALLFVFWKEFELYTFDSDYASSLGFSGRLLNTLLTGLIVVAIIIGLQAVGVILMVAMLVAPASAARQWTNRLKVMVVLAAFFGTISGVSGAVLSSIFNNLPTGPVIVLCITAIVLFSLMFAPKRGILPKLVRRARNHRRIQLDSVLADLYLLEANHPEKNFIGHSARVIATMNSRKSGVDKSLYTLERLGMVSKPSERYWKLTPKGWQRADKVIHRQEKNMTAD